MVDEIRKCPENFADLEAEAVSVIAMLQRCQMTNEECLDEVLQTWESLQYLNERLDRSVSSMKELADLEVLYEVRRHAVLARMRSGLYHSESHQVETPEIMMSRLKTETRETTTLGVLRVTLAMAKQVAAAVRSGDEQRP